MDTNDLTLDDNLASLLTPHTEVELGTLEDSLRTDGLLSPLLIWVNEGRRVLLDGFARYRLAMKLKLPIRWAEVPLPDRDAAVEFRLRQQLSRRNLCQLAQAYYRGHLYRLLGKRPGARTDLPTGQADAQMTARGLAERFGCSERTIRRDQRLAEAVDLLGKEEHLTPVFKALLLSGCSRLPRREVFRLLHMKQAERERYLEGRKAEREARQARPRRKPAAAKVAGSSGSNSGANTPAVVNDDGGRTVTGVADRDAALVTRRPDNAGVAGLDPTTPVPAGELPPDIRLHHADNRAFDWPDIDLCFTDPPYADLPAYEWLGGMLSRKLRPGRLALVYADGFRLPEQIRLLTAAGLRYVTLFGITYPMAFGSKPLLGFMSNNIRPVVLLSQGKPTPPGRLIFAGRVQEPFPKPHHPWQQALEPAVEWISRLVKPGDLVADPFLGSGTTAVAVRQIGGLRFIGTEIDGSTYCTAHQRVATEVPAAGGAEQEIDDTAVEGLLARWREFDPPTRLAFLSRSVVQAAIQRLNAASEGHE